MSEQLIRNSALELEDLFKSLKHAEECQYERPPARSNLMEDGDPGTHEKASNGRIRQKGHISDPTGSIATDPSRLELRETLKETEKTLFDIFHKIRNARSSLDRSVRPWT